MERRIEVKDIQKTGSLYVTPKELIVVRGIAEGKTTREIAREREVSYKTVEAQRRDVLRRLGCKNSPHLIYTLCQQRILLPEGAPELTNPSQ